MGEEAEALDAQACYGAEDHFHEEWDADTERVYQKILHKLQCRMGDTRRADVGATVRCPQCEKLMVKTSYQKVFCSNAKTHGKGNCKDKYHNRVAGLKSHLFDLRMRG